MTTIRPLKPHEIHLCVPFGQAFHEELNLAGQFTPATAVELTSTISQVYRGKGNI